MRYQPDQIHNEPMNFKGVGQIYVASSVARVLSWGTFGQLAVGLPCGAVLSALLNESGVVFFAGYGAGSVVGWCGGMILASLTAQKLAKVPSEERETDRQLRLAELQMRWAGRRS